ncbi:MAG: hypothetical protein RMY34_24220 [Aulosira sp. DedQUE10]|nr:hypothetical protein [Aulosira sp. DedQUE10]
MNRKPNLVCAIADCSVRKMRSHPQVHNVIKLESYRATILPKAGF